MRLRFSLLVLALSLVAMFATAASAAAKPQPSYVALGDSYTAGDGTGDFYTSPPYAAACYQSPEAYPPLVAVDKGYSLTFAACSGATTQTLIANQLSSLKKNTDFVTVQIGGNDVKFSTVIASCLPGLSLSPLTCNEAIAYAELLAVTKLPGSLAATYTNIRRASPHAEVAVLGYPHLFDGVGTTCGLSAQAGLTSSDEIAMNQAANLLDSVIQFEAVTHGFNYVDPQAAFSSDEVCSTPDPWINGITDLSTSTPSLLPQYEWFHPNIGGEATFANLIEGAL